MAAVNRELTLLCDLTLKEASDARHKFAADPYAFPAKLVIRGQAAHFVMKCKWSLKHAVRIVYIGEI